jgi:AcrR family transcriptional regulator
MKNGSLELGGRRKPTQQRAIESVDTILATAAVLLDEVGVEGFNTNLLAERAGVRVRTVYRYYPNKYAVIMALTKSLAVQWDNWMQRRYEALADPKGDWKTAMRISRDEWIVNARQVPGSLSVLQAMYATPELREFHFQIFENMSAQTARALRNRGVKLPPTKLLAIGRVIVTAINGGVDVLLQISGKEAKAFIAEMDEFQEAYLEKYLGKSGK